MNVTALEQDSTDRPGLRVQTRSGRKLRLHLAEPVAGAALGYIFAGLSAEDVQFRLVASPEAPGSRQFSKTVAIDHRRTEHVIAIDEVTNRPVASLIIAADPHRAVADVAIAVADDGHGHGIGWALLEHAADLARAQGIRKLRSVGNRADSETLEIEHALGFRPRVVADVPRLVPVGG